MTYYFATTNPGKFSEVEEKFKEAGLELEQFNEELTEIQSDNIEEIALNCAREAFEKLGKPVFVEDAGLFIKSLKDFPGPYSKHAFFTIGPEGILKLLEGAQDRSAYFQAVIAYKDADKEKVFKGVCKGNIAAQVRGRGGFGFDPVFLPEGRDATFAEDVKTKASLSHRALAVEELISWLKNG
jgi:XTP/dITP diphosphohydrolase